MRFTAVLLSLIAFYCFQSVAQAAPAMQDTQTYLASVRREIQTQLGLISGIADGDSAQVEFDLLSYGGHPSNIETTEPGQTSRNELVKKRLKECNFKRFEIQDPKTKHKADKLHVNAIISYHASAKPNQIDVDFKSVDPQVNQPLWRLAAILFTITITVCASVCVFVQTIIVVIGGCSLAMEWFKNTKKSDVHPTEG